MTVLKHSTFAMRRKYELFDDRMVIYYNTPKTMNLDESQGFSFYDRNVAMPCVILNKKNCGTQDFGLIMCV